MQSETLNLKQRILLVEDNPGDARLIEEMIKDLPEVQFELDRVDRLSSGLERIQKGDIDLILLDLSLPDSHGLETYQKVHAAVSNIPIVILTGLEDDELSIQAIGHGAQDYLVKSKMDSHSFTHTIHYSIERQRLMEELKAANQKILDQQKSVIEQERLKVLLQMAGATAHEINQPLTALLGNIDLLMLSEEVPDQIADKVDKIKESGQCIADIVKKIQAIRHDEVKPYFGNDFIINIDQEIKILSVEDDRAFFAMLKNMLSELGVTRLFHTINIQEAKQLLGRNTYDLILLDYKLPDGDAFDLLKFVKKQDLWVSIIVLTGQGDEIIASQAIQSGAQDYLPKGNLSNASLSRSINTALEKFRLNREINMAMVKIAEMSTRDELTGLYNRRYFTEALEREVARVVRYNTNLTLCMLDLDHFKTVNDTYGHPAGDMVLAQTGRMLREHVRENDLVCRYGGEEFVVLMPNTGLNEAKAAFERFRKNISKHVFTYNSSKFQLTASLGIASYQHESRQLSTDLVAAADRALYRAKQTGRNKVILSITATCEEQRPKLGQVLLADGYIVKNDLDKALSEQRLKLGNILLKADLITGQQLERALSYQKKAYMKLGEILKLLGYITTEDLNWALDRMKRKLGEILKEMGMVNEYELQLALSAQEKPSN